MDYGFIKDLRTHLLDNAKLQIMTKGVYTTPPPNAETPYVLIKVTDVQHSDYPKRLRMSFDLEVISTETSMIEVMLISHALRECLEETIKGEAITAHTKFISAVLTSKKPLKLSFLSLAEVHHD